MTPFLVLSLLLSFNINGLEGTKDVDDLEIDRQLKMLNKPYIKSIKIEEGDIFDCVDIYKQPAFDNPLLKNHKVQMRPSSFPKKMADAISPSDTNPFTFGLSEACPSGTVPIKRVGKEDLIRAQKFMKNSHQTNDVRVIENMATARVPSQAGVEYFGAAAQLNVQNPQVTNNQYSQAFVQIGNDPDDEENKIRFGWMVNPKLYGDNATRTFAAWTARSTHGDFCLNTLCPGFVQVSPMFPLGYVLRNISVYGGQQFIVRCIIFKEHGLGNWWLAHDTFQIIVGYWPSTLFTTLKKSASEIRWGGAAFNDNNETCPPMGSGHFASEDFRKAAYIRDIQTIDNSSNFNYPDDDLLQYIPMSPNCYSVEPLEGMDHALLYGGPGGNCN
ncbi:hypothetical protein FCV25MIE_25597 [Fagus crenata]